MRAGKIVAGTDSVISELPKRKIKVVIIANDLKDNAVEKVTRASEKNKIKIVAIFSSEELEHAIGKKRKVIGLCDAGFFKALVKKINEGVWLDG